MGVTDGLVLSSLWSTDDGRLSLSKEACESWMALHPRGGARCRPTWHLASSLRVKRSLEGWNRSSLVTRPFSRKQSGMQPTARNGSPSAPRVVLLLCR
jgi:hypothetical protein